MQKRERNFFVYVILNTELSRNLLGKFCTLPAYDNAYYYDDDDDS